MKQRVCIGKIASAHGVKGLVKLLPYCDDVSLLDGKVFTDETGTDTLEITLKNALGKYVLAQVKGIDTREDAEKLKSLLYIPREDLPKIDNDDEFYIEDLVGLSAQTPDGTPLGRIKAVDNFGAGDLLEIAPLGGGQSYYVPFHDDFVSNIDLATKNITITNHDQFIIT